MTPLQLKRLNTIQDLLFQVEEVIDSAIRDDGFTSKDEHLAKAKKLLDMAGFGIQVVLDEEERPTKGVAGE